jgi:hypothetical protein
VQVLLPGTEDIAGVMSDIEQAAQEHDAVSRFEFMPCHGDLTPEEQDLVQSPLPPGTLRFVCGTEILRSSVTVPETVGLIDSLQIKRNLTEANGVSHLTKIAVSKAEADQARGRPGRTGPGFYMPISYQDEYHNLEPYPMPAVLREPITKVALQVASIGRSIHRFQWIDAPDNKRVEVAIRRLKLVGALDDNEQITNVGYLLADLSCDPEPGKALFTGNELGVLPEVAINVAARDAGGFFQLPKRESDVIADEWLTRLVLSHFQYEGRFWYRLSAPRDMDEVDLNNLPEWVATEGRNYKLVTGFTSQLRDARAVAAILRRDWAGTSRSDFVAVVRAYRAFKAEQRRLWEVTGYDGRPLSVKERNQRLRTWCRMRMLNYRRLRQTDESLRQIREDLQGTQLHLNGSIVNDREFDEEALTKALLSGLIDNLAVNSDRNNYHGPLGHFNVAWHSACVVPPVHRMNTPQQPQIVLVGGVSKIPDAHRIGEVLVSELAAPVKQEWLAEVVPQLCRTVNQDDYIFYDAEQDEVVQWTDMYFLSLAIGERLVRVPDDEQAAMCFKEWLAGQECEPVWPANKAQQDRARFLNNRLQRPLFKVWSQWELADFLWQQLGHLRVRSIKDVRNPEVLALPPLDESLIASVQHDFPDEIEVLGRKCTVFYGQHPSGQHPSVELSAEMVAPPEFLQLPDDGVRLAGGLLIMVSIKFSDGTTIANTNIVELKEQLTQTLRKQVFAAWLPSSDAQIPVVEMPDPADPTSTIPEIIEATYGSCPLTGKTLTAYGSLCIDRSFAPGAKPFTFSWHMHRESAQFMREGAVNKLQGMRALLQEDEERAKLNPEIQQLQELLAQLTSEYRNELPEEMLGNMRRRSAEVLSPTMPLPEVRQWLEAAWGLADRAERNGSQEQRLTTEAVLHDFGGDVRMRLVGNQGCNDFFVVGSDGSLRGPDESAIRRGTEGTKIWKRVARYEAALSWRLSSRAGQHNFEAHHLPEGGCTQEQLATIQKLEEEIWDRWEVPHSTRAAAHVNWGWTAKLPRK